MKSRFGMAQRVWVMDRGMVSHANLAWLHKTGRRYVMGGGRHELPHFSTQFADEEGWQKLREGIEVKLLREGDETFVLCRSLDRRRKEAAMHERFSQRIVQGLESLDRRLKRARTRLDCGPIERQIGRLLQRNARAAGRFKIQIHPDPALAAGLRLQWSTRDQWDQLQRHTEGCYVLRTNVHEWSAATLWQTYTQLTQAEAAFRTHKSDLSIRPLWHHREERVQAHIFVCFLAYVLWKTLEQWQARASLGNSPRTLLTELRRLECVDVVLPIAETPPREIRLRCVVRPDKAQADLLARLGLRLPERLRLPSLTAKM